MNSPADPLENPYAAPPGRVAEHERVARSRTRSGRTAMPEGVRPRGVALRSGVVHDEPPMSTCRGSAEPERAQAGQPARRLGTGRREPGSDAFHLQESGPGPRARQLAIGGRLSRPCRAASQGPPGWPRPSKGWARAHRMGQRRCSAGCSMTMRRTISRTLPSSVIGTTSGSPAGRAAPASGPAEPGQPGRWRLGRLGRQQHVALEEAGVVAGGVRRAASRAAMRACGRRRGGRALGALGGRVLGPPNSPRVVVNGLGARRSGPAAAPAGAGRDEAAAAASTGSSEPARARELGRGRAGRGTSRLAAGAGRALQVLGHALEQHLRHEAERLEDAGALRGHGLDPGHVPRVELAVQLLAACRRPAGRACCTGAPTAGRRG